MKMHVWYLQHEELNFYTRRHVGNKCVINEEVVFMNEKAAYYVKRNYDEDSYPTTL